jgi:hypothetical protein
MGMHKSSNGEKFNFKNMLLERERVLTGKTSKNVCWMLRHVVHFVEAP